MTQGATSSRVPTLPVVHLAHLVETGAWFAIGGVVGGAVLAMLIRWRGWSWTCALPLLVAVPEASLFSWRAELCADAFAVAAVGIGAWATWPTCGPAATWHSEHAVASAR
jgi:hypothetical protein